MRNIHCACAIYTVHAQYTLCMRNIYNFALTIYNFACTIYNPACTIYTVHAVHTYRLSAVQPH